VRYLALDRARRILQAPVERTIACGRSTGKAQWKTAHSAAPG
jgi:hypothetical protein